MMRTVTACFREPSGWSRDLPVELDSDRTLVLAFGDSTLVDRTELFDEVARSFPRSCLMGCSTGGEILGDRVYDDCLAIAVVRFDDTEIGATYAEASADGSIDAGRRIGSELASSGLEHVFILADGIDIDGTALVEGMKEGLPKDVMVTGGLAADGDRFERTWVLREGRPEFGQIAAIGLYGDRVQVGHGSKGGWDIFGPERLVTRSEGRVLYELDGRPALELYKTYLGDLATGLPATGLLFPLALRSSRPNGNGGREANAQQVVRTILAVDEEEQSMTFAGDIPQGDLAQLMKANFDRIIDGAEQAAVMTQVNVPEAENGLAIAVSCVGRRWLLGERTEEELERTLDILPRGIEQIGYYSYGEISPSANGSCDLHNQTMTLTTIAER